MKINQLKLLYSLGEICFKAFIRSSLVMINSQIFLEGLSSSICMFISTVRKYTRAKTLTPRMLNELIDHIEVHQAEKIDGIWEQHLVIHYNCVGAIFIPDVFPLPAPQVSVNTRKGVVVNYAPGQLAV